MSMKKVNIKIYISALIITLIIFSTAFFTSTYFNNKKTQELRAIEDEIAVDILSFETEYAIFEESSCKEFNRESLKASLNDLAQKLAFMEGQVGKDDPEVYRLKRYYSLLQIRDYLLLKRMSDQCKLDTTFILYFYSQGSECAQCQTQEYMLRAIRTKYPQIEMYTFDYDVDLPAIQTLITLHNIPKNPPIIDINGKAYAAFDSLADMEAIVKPLVNPVATSTATSTKTQ